MSIDATYDMIQAGQKVRCLAMPFGIDTRGLSGRNENMKTTQAEIDKLAQDASAEMARLTTQIAQAARRVSALERGGNGTQDDFPLPEYSVDINRATGTVSGGRDYCPVPSKKNRELENDADLPEYYVPVNRTKGTIGEDR